MAHIPVAKPNADLAEQALNQRAPENGRCGRPPIYHVQIEPVKPAGKRQSGGADHVMLKAASNFNAMSRF
jgi:hypothetical protein